MSSVFKQLGMSFLAGVETKLILTTIMRNYIYRYAQRHTPFCANKTPFIASMGLS